MTCVAILPERTAQGEISFHAFSGTNHSRGKTAGEALDSLTSLLPANESSALVIVQSFRPDKFFSKACQDRLSHLLELRRSADGSNAGLSAAELSELQALVDKELRAATDRAAELVKDLHL